VNPPRTWPEQVRDQDRQLNVRFLKQCLKAVLKLNAITRELILASHDRAPQPLLRIGYKTQRQFLGHETFDQSFRIGEILLPSGHAPIRLCLRQMQASGDRIDPGPGLSSRRPVPLEGLPHRTPILRGRLHDHFLDVERDQPLR